MKKDILFLCQFFYPEHNSSATLPFDTAKFLASQGLSVDALVGYPKEYSSEKNLPLKETVEGVHIQRMRYLQLKRGSKLGRLINYFSFTANALLRLGKLRKYRSVIVYSNPPLLPLVAMLGNMLFGTKIVFVSYDVYPEVAYASGSLKPGGLIDRVMRWINGGLFKRVSAVVALTEEMKQFLLEHRSGLTEDRVHVIANWAHEKKTEVTKEAFEAFGYEEENFIVSYFGNLGICQDVETMLDAAQLLKDDPKIRFLIVGHGTKFDYVSRQIQQRELTNVQLLSFLTGKRFEQAVAISDCCIVTLEKGLKGMCAPSKFYSYLQGGKPVLAVVEEGSYLQQILSCHQVGASVSVGEGENLARLIRKLSDDSVSTRKMGRCAQALYDEQYAMEIGMDHYRKLFRQLL